MLRNSVATTIADIATVELDRVAPDVAEADVEEDGVMLTAGGVGVEMAEGVREVIRTLVLGAELDDTKDVTEGEELEDDAEGRELGLERGDDVDEDVAEVTLDDEAEVLGKAELAASDRDEVTVAGMEDVAELLPIVMVEITVLGGALATEEGTGTVEVSLETGELNDPDMPSRLTLSVRTDLRDGVINVREGRRVLTVMPCRTAEGSHRSEVDIALQRSARLERFPDDATLTSCSSQVPQMGRAMFSISHATVEVEVKTHSKLQRPHTRNIDRFDLLYQDAVSVVQPHKACVNACEERCLAVLNPLDEARLSCMASCGPGRGGDLTSAHSAYESQHRVDTTHENGSLRQ